jgi:hypothetical protein
MRYSFFRYPAIEKYDERLMVFYFRPRAFRLVWPIPRPVCITLLGGCEWVSGSQICCISIANFAKDDCIDLTLQPI